MRILPPGATRDAAVLLQTRGIRAFGDGIVSVVLAVYLTAVGLSDARVGIIVAATLLGSAALTLAVGLRGNRIGRRRLLQLVSLLLIATGLGFAAATSFWPLMVVAIVGTLNPSGGDVSVFLADRAGAAPGDRTGRAAHGAVRPLQPRRRARRRGRRAVRGRAGVDRRPARRGIGDRAALDVPAVRRARAS